MTTYAADKYIIRITQGNIWDYPLTFSSSLAGVKTPINLTGATITGVVRPTFTGGTPVIMTVTPVNLANGQVRFSLSPTQTNTLPPGNLVYDITINNLTYMSGNFVVKPKVQTV